MACFAALRLVALPVLLSVASEFSAGSFRKLEEEEFEIGFSTALLLKDKPLESFRSRYQQIDVFESAADAADGNSGYFGKVFVLDGNIQLTERDAPNYNEMLAHVSMMEFGSELKTLPKRVLVIGGGDGYVVSEVLRHPSVITVDHVELDQGVIDISAKHFPWTRVKGANGTSHSLWEDERVNLHVVDAADFVKKASSEFYDIIIQDSSDPEVVEKDGTLTVLPGSVLFTDVHFSHLHRALSPEGVFAFQAETYNIPSSLKSIRNWRDTLLKTGFAKVQYATIAIPTYSTGQIGIHVCSKQTADAKESRSLEDIRKWTQERFGKLSGETKYYHPRLQTSCFDLPNWVEKYIYGQESSFSSDEL